jgi:aryl-alcohol dehydrogenase-like predicted oxidoreductase
MEKRRLGKTDLEIPVVGFGASSLGQEFRMVTLEEAMQSVRVAMDLGMNFIDTSPFYGRGMSEVLLGIALRDVRREDYTLCTKLGRYDLNHFDFSARRVEESIDVSLHRLGVSHLDIILAHDIEFVEMQQVVEETIPAMVKARDQGKVRYIGFSGYPMKIFPFVLDQVPVDVILSYNQYTLQNTRLADLIPYFRDKGVGIMNAGPFAARLLTNAILPEWHKEPAEVKATCRKAAEYCASKGVDIAKLALQYSVFSNTEIATTITGSANPANIRKWAQWVAEPYEEELINEVLQILEPVKNLGHTEGLAKNN